MENQFSEVVYSIVPFLVIGFFIVFPIYLKKKKTAENLEKLKKTAVMLSLKFSETSDSITKIFPFLKLNQGWEMNGEYNGVAVNVKIIPMYSNKRGSIQIEITAFFKPPLPYGLQIGKEGFFSKLGAAVLGKQDIQSGNAEFDKAFQIKGDSVAAIQSLVRRPEIQKAIREAFDISPSFIVSFNNHEISALTYDVVTEVEEYRSILKKFTDAVRAFQERT